MKVIVDLINKSLKILENEKNIYVGNNNADVLKLYCYNKDYSFVNEFVSITGLLSNGRKIGAFTTDSAYESEVIDGNPYIVANFTLTKQNGFTLSEGQLNITVWHNKTNDNGAIVSKQAIGNLLFNVVKTANVDDNIIITDTSGDVIYNFKLEIENIQSAVADINNKLNTKANTAYVEQQLALINNELIDKVSFETLNEVIYDVEENVDNKIANLVNSAPATLDTLGEIAAALQENDEVVDVLNEAISTKANKEDVPTKLSDLEIDIAVGGGVSEEEVLDIIEDNSVQAQAISIGKSTSFDSTSDNQIPTSKAVKDYVDSVLGDIETLLGGI